MLDIESQPRNIAPPLASLDSSVFDAVRDGATMRSRITSAAAAIAAVAMVALGLGLSAGAVAGCKQDTSRSHKTELAVFAASSLTEAFQALERGFEAAHPDVDVALTFAGSQVLRLQLEQGARADIFASANEAHMQALVDADLVAGSQVFAHNELVIIVPADRASPVHSPVQSVADLPEATRLVIGSSHVPVGVYTRQLFANMRARLGDDFVDRVQQRVVSEESNVRLVRAKVELGEADAAIVYRTDATSSERVRLVAIPDELNVRARYLIGPLAASARPENAARFIIYVRSEEGRRILEQHGFVTEVR